ncbi:hypothetical protein NQ318_012002 [Aromia moschata]|uniref:PiggyBac transposable element-derived protein 4 C-terminal zinc-ribbon domain-containing protein n=1 Tax=Aromia moschata TaxID=1265417 RepID=A0AAV8XI08_9CUCU|nr:hypothetical protein NQ318_012002 [Aromia moschata]
MLNIAGINSQIIFSANNPKTNLARRNFLRELANGFDLNRQELFGTDQEAQQNANPGRCGYCDWKKNRKTRFSCFKCNTYMCLEHITAICKPCRESALQDQ